MAKQQCITIAARKGGVGKSSLASGLASVFAHQGRRVLAVDLDPQSNLPFILGVDPTAPGTAALLLGENPLPLEAVQNLHVLPGGPALNSHTIQSLDPEDLADAVQNLDYDLVLFDCPPGIETLERMGLIAADVVLVATDAHPLAVVGAGRVIAELEARRQKGRRGAKRWAFVLSRIDQRRTLDQLVEARLGELYPDTPLLRVRQDASVANAAADQVPIVNYAPACRAVEDIKAVAQWVLDG